MKQAEQLKKGIDSWAHIDLPALEMVFNQKITFYEDDSPSLQKISVNDNLGYNPYLASNENTIRETVAVHESLTVPLNSFVEDFSTTESPRPPSTFDVKESLGVKTGHAFTSETLKGIYNMGGILGTSKVRERCRERCLK